MAQLRRGKLGALRVHPRLPGQTIGVPEPAPFWHDLDRDHLRPPVDWKEFVPCEAPAARSQFDPLADDQSQAEASSDDDTQTIRCGSPPEFRRKRSRSASRSCSRSNAPPPARAAPSTTGPPLTRSSDGEGPSVIDFLFSPPASSPSVPAFTSLPALHV